MILSSILSLSPEQEDDEDVFLEKDSFSSPLVISGLVVMGGNEMNLPLMCEWNVPSDWSSLTCAQMYMQSKAVRAQWELLCRLFHLDVEILPNSLFLFIYGMPDQRQRVFRISISRREAACHPPQTSSAPQEWRLHPTKSVTPFNIIIMRSFSLSY